MMCLIHANFIIYLYKTKTYSTPSLLFWILSYSCPLSPPPGVVLLHRLLPYPNSVCSSTFQYSPSLCNMLGWSNGLGCLVWCPWFSLVITLIVTGFLPSVCKMYVEGLYLEILALLLCAFSLTLTPLVHTETDLNKIYINCQPQHQMQCSF